MLLYQPKNGYCYNSDTHFLHDFILHNLKRFKNVSGNLLDIGSGSGILGLLVARDYDKLHLHQCELQESFEVLSLINARVNKIDTTMYKGCFQELPFDKQFDICVSNPPFYHANVIKSENESLKIARYNDAMPLEAFIQKSAKVLKSSGKFFFCYDAKQLQSIMIALQHCKFNIEALRFVHPNGQKDATLVLVYARKNSKSLMKILPALYVFDDSQFTQEVQNIYKQSSTHSIKVEL